MNLPQQIRQEFLGPLFTPTSNAGTPIPHIDTAAKAAGEDIKERAARNAGSRKTKEPASAKAERWIDRHIQVYHLFVDVALKLKAKGRTHYGAKAIAEYLRMHSDVEGGEDYKVANIAVTYMALRAMKEFPQLEGFFKTTKKKDE